MPKSKNSTTKQKIVLPVRAKKPKPLYKPRTKSNEYRAGQKVELESGVYKIAYAPAYPVSYLYVWYKQRYFGQTHMKIKRIRIADIKNK